MSKNQTVEETPVEELTPEQRSHRSDLYMKMIDKMIDEDDIESVQIGDTLIDLTFYKENRKKEIAEKEATSTVK